MVQKYNGSKVQGFKGPKFSWQRAKCSWQRKSKHHIVKSKGFTLKEFNGSKI